MDALPLKTTDKKKAPWWVRTLRILGIVLGIAVAAVILVVLVNDAFQGLYVPRGVLLGGVDLGGMTREQAREAADRRAKELAAVELELRVGQATEQAALGRFVSFDEERLVDEIMGVRPNTPFLARFQHDWLDVPLPEREMALRSRIDKTAIRSFVEGLAQRYDTKAKAAKLEIDESAYSVSITPDVTGVVVSRTAAVSAMIRFVEKVAGSVGRGEAQWSGAGGTGSASVGTFEVPYEATAAKVTAEGLRKKNTLIVSLRQRKIYLYKGEDLVKTYRCAVGSGGYPTPRGDFSIVAKRYMPTWSNPGSGWASDMPRTIPPGYSNPLGVRALNLNAPGIRIHGTNNIGSIGSAASHGCMRVANGQIIDLYDRVKVGDPVYIRF